MAAAAANLLKKRLPEDIRDQLSELMESIPGIKEETEEFVRNEFSSWCASMKAVLPEIAVDHGKRVADRYFSGAVPCKAKKAREDIPDGFIWEAVLDIRNENSELIKQKKASVVFVSKDNNLRSACSKEENIECFSSLGDFVGSPSSQTLLKKLYAADNLDRLRLLLPKSRFALKHTVEQESVNALAVQNVTSQVFPSDNGEALILSVEQPQHIQFGFEDLQYYGAGTLILPFSFETECLFSYALFKSEYFVLGEDRSEGISISELNRHYFDAEEYFDTDVKGLLALELSEDVLEKADAKEAELLDALEDADMEIDTIESVNVWPKLIS